MLSIIQSPPMLLTPLLLLHLLPLLSSPSPLPLFFPTTFIYLQTPNHNRPEPAIARTHIRQLASSILSASNCPSALHSLAAQVCVLCHPATRLPTYTHIIHLHNLQRHCTTTLKRALTLVTVCTTRFQRLIAATFPARIVRPCIVIQLGSQQQIRLRYA
jgi:hypothetical protein